MKLQAYKVSYERVDLLLDFSYLLYLPRTNYYKC